MTVDDCLESAPEPQRSTLSFRDTLHEILPDATETLTYGKPTMTVDGKGIGGYAHYKDRCSYFPHSGSVLPEFADELESYRWSKGAIQFPVDEPLPKTLVARLVEARLKELDNP